MRNLLWSGLCDPCLLIGGELCRELVLLPSVRMLVLLKPIASRCLRGLRSCLLTNVFRLLMILLRMIRLSRRWVYV